MFANANEFKKSDKGIQNDELVTMKARVTLPIVRIMRNYRVPVTNINVTKI